MSGLGNRRDLFGVLSFRSRIWAIVSASKRRAAFIYSSSGFSFSGAGGVSFSGFTRVETSSLVSIENPP